MREPITKIKRVNDYKKNYGLRLQIGFIGSLSIFLILFNISISSDSSKPLFIEVQEEVFVEEIAQTKQITNPPLPPRPPVPIEVPNDELMNDEIVDLDLDFELDRPINLPPAPPANNDEEEIFIVVEQPPVLIGGLASVQQRIKYPEIARNAGIEGRVVIQFVVTSEGNIADPKIIRGIGGGCDEAALEALKFAKFQPGYQRGRPVNVSYSMPISFTLKSK